MLMACGDKKPSQEVAKSPSAAQPIAETAVVPVFTATTSSKTGGRATALVAQLKPYAASGDASAACRIAVEYESCAFVDGHLGRAALELRKDRESGSGIERESALAFARDREKLVLERSWHCEGLPLLTSDERIALWRNAAKAGSVPAMAAYSSGAVFSSNEIMNQLAALEAYRAEAVDMARSAAKAGNADAILSLAVAYDPNERVRLKLSLLSQLVAEDAKEAMTLYSVYVASTVAGQPDSAAQLRSVRKKMSLLESQLSPSELNEVRVEAESRRAGWKPIEHAAAAGNIGSLSNSGSSLSEFCGSAR